MSTSVCHSQKLKNFHPDAANGKRIYNNGCIACHGSTGQGASRS